MCLYQIDDCPLAPEELHQILTKPSPSVLAAGLRRCPWWQVTNSQAANEAEAASLCPYVVVRHDEDPILDDELEKIDTATLHGYVFDKGCPICWESVCERDWRLPMPTRRERETRFGKELVAKGMATPKPVRDDCGSTVNLEGKTHMDEDMSDGLEFVSASKKRRRMQSRYLPAPKKQRISKFANITKEKSNGAFQPQLKPGEVIPPRPGARAPSESSDSESLVGADARALPRYNVSEASLTQLTKNCGLTKKPPPKGAMGGTSRRRPLQPDFYPLETDSEADEEEETEEAAECEANKARERQGNAAEDEENEDGGQADEDEAPGEESEEEEVEMDDDDASQSTVTTHEGCSFVDDPDDDDDDNADDDSAIMIYRSFFDDVGDSVIITGEKTCTQDDMGLVEATGSTLQHRRFEDHVGKTIEDPIEVESQSDAAADYHEETESGHQAQAPTPECRGDIIEGSSRASSIRPSPAPVIRQEGPTRPLSPPADHDRGDAGDAVRLNVQNGSLLRAVEEFADQWKRARDAILTPVDGRDAADERDFDLMGRRRSETLQLVSSEHAAVQEGVQEGVQGASDAATVAPLSPPPTQT